MYEHNQHTDNNNSTKIDKKFLDALYEFIHSVEFELDMMLPGFVSLRFLSYYKITDYIISQKLSKNIIIRMLCPLDEDNGRLTKQLVPFIGYKSIKPTLPKTSTNSLFFIRDKQDIFSFSIDIQKQRQYYNKKGNIENNNKGSDTIFYVNDWSYCKNVSIVRNTSYCFDTIWEEKENYERIVKEKKHSELLFDVVSHDIGNYHQILLSSLEVVSSLFRKNNNNNNDTPDSFSKNNERILSCLTVAKNALTKSQSLVDNIRRLERLHTQKEDLKLILKNLQDAINSAYSTVEQTLYENNPNGKRIRISINLVQNQNRTDINIIAEDLLEEIFINLFSNSVKYTDSAEVKIDVLLKDYFIGEAKYWMIMISDHGKGIPDPMKKELFERFYSKAKGSGLGLSIVRTLVERYKGKIWVGDRVYEDYTKGTTFGMIFP
ncbi:MAG: HAMP domain-containing sensor histidine kinase, partial [Candidatus Nitrosopolaris sp.]